MTDKLEPGQTQPPLVLAQVYSPGPEEEGLGSVFTALLILWRRRYLVLAILVFFLLLAAMWTAAEETEYQATATLILRPPQFSTELQPAPLSVETYRSILESDFIGQRVIDVLRQKRKFNPELSQATFRNMHEVRTHVHQERNNAGQRSYSPLIDLVATANSPEVAAQIANTWAEVFIEENVGLTSQGKQDTLEFIEAQYPALSETLQSQEASLTEKKDYYGTAQVKLEQAWNQRLLEFKTSRLRAETEFENETEKLKADYQNETERLSSDYERETERLSQELIKKGRPALLEREMETRSAKLETFREELLGTELELETKRALLENTKKQIEAQPQFLTLSKAITDTALWTNVGTLKPDVLEQLQKLRLQSEQVNTIHERLLDSLIRVQIEYESLLPRKRDLESEIAKLNSEIDDLMARQAEHQIAAFSLSRSREAGLNSLLNDRISGLVSLGRTRETEQLSLEEARLSQLDSLEKERADEISSLERKTNAEVGALEREVTLALKTYDLIADKFNSAQLAKSEEESDVKIGARAVVPDGPVRSPMALNLVIALTAGILISLVAVFLLELRDRLSAADMKRAPMSTAGHRKMVLENATLLGRHPKSPDATPPEGGE